MAVLAKTGFASSLQQLPAIPSLDAAIRKAK